MEQNPSQRPVLLVHAWSESAGAFDRMVELLPDHLIPMAVDLPGDVAALAGTSGTSVQGLADHLASVLRTLNHATDDSQKAVVVGTSSGGYLAQQLAVDHPDLLGGLVLIGAPISLAGRPAFADEVERLCDPVDGDWVRQFFTWFPLHNPVPAAYIEDRIRDAQAIPARVWRETLAALYLSTPPLATGTITAPTLIIAGGNDDLLGPVHLDLAAAIPYSRTRVYDNTGHLVLWEQPELVAADTASFIQTLGPAPAAQSGRAKVHGPRHGPRESRAVSSPSA